MANQLFRNLRLWAVNTKAAVCLNDWRMDTLAIVMWNSSKYGSLLSSITSDIAGEVCLSQLLLIHIQALRALYCPALKNQYCEYCVGWAYLISMVVMATLQGIDSSTGISGLDGPCIEAEIFCPVKSKHVLQWTLFHTCLDHQNWFFFFLSLLGVLVEGAISQIFPVNSITDDIADMIKRTVKIIWIKWKTLKILLLCFVEHSESCRLGVFSVALPWILLFMYWIYYGPLKVNKLKRFWLERTVICIRTLY